jgi:hypothetical protein
MSGRTSSPPRSLRPESEQDYKSLLTFLEKESNVRELNLPTIPSRWKLFNRKDPNKLYEDDVKPLIAELKNAIQTGNPISDTSSEKLKSINTMLSETSRVLASKKMARDTAESFKKRQEMERWDSLTPAQRDEEFNKGEQDRLKWEKDTLRINAESRAEMAAHDATRHCPEHYCHPRWCKWLHHSVKSYLTNNPPPKGGRSKRSNKSKSKSRSKRSKKSKHTKVNKSCRRR